VRRETVGYLVRRGATYLRERDPVFGMRWSHKQHGALRFESRAEALECASRAMRYSADSARVVRLVRRA
jgi:hypothetical protein